MRFKLFMIYDLGDFNEERIIANNQNQSKINVQIFNPKSKVLEPEFVYK